MAASAPGKPEPTDSQQMQAFVRWPCSGVAGEEDNHVPLQRKQFEMWLSSIPGKDQEGERGQAHLMWTLTSSDHVVGFWKPPETRVFPQEDRQPASSGG